MINEKRSVRREASIDDASFRFLAAELIAAILIIAILATYLTVFMINMKATSPDPNQQGSEENEDYPFKKDGIVIELPSVDSAEHGIPDEFINSERAVLVDVTAKKIVASRQGAQIIYPASMTKVMTLIVVAENLKTEASLNEMLEIKHAYGENSGLGYPIGTELTIKDLLHAAILQSDGVACLTLAEYIAGSEAGFVKLMNEKARELGLDENSTLFQNCTGLYHQYHFSTCRDIAIIMAYAMENPLCSSILTAQKYESENADLFYHTLFSPKYLYTNQPKKAEIISGKTGFTEKDTSGYCIVTYARGDNGHFYVSVTAKAESWAANVEDVLTIYNEYIK